ncbi:MAG: glycerophosphodiester phosphodiesterase family protein [bacterium]
MKHTAKRILFIIPLLLFLALCTLRFAPSAVASQKEITTIKPNLNILKIAHRGSKKFAPENTIPAIEKAIELGFDYVELDVRYTKDGLPVVMHDPSLVRTTGVFKDVKDMTLEEIRRLDAGFWFGEKFKGTRVPSLEDALAVMQGRIKLYLDQKEPPNKELIGILKKYNFYPDNIVIVGENMFQRIFRMLDKNAPVMPNIKGAADIDKILKEFPHPRAFNTNHYMLSDELVAKAHQNGVMVFMNTLVTGEDPAVMRSIIEAGTDALQTDEPTMLLEVLSGMKKESEEKK